MHKQQNELLSIARYQGHERLEVKFVDLPQAVVTDERRYLSTTRVTTHFPLPRALLPKLGI